MRAFTVAVEGANIAGERHGPEDGVPLVLVHGFGGSRHDWDLVVSHLDPRRPLITYDLRGFGSSRAEAGVAFSHTDDLLAMLDALGLDHAHLVGLSLGGATALGAALAAPDRIGKLVLVSPMLAGWSWSAQWIDLWKAMGRAARAGDLDQARALWLAHPLFDSVRQGPQGDRLAGSIAAFAGRQWVADDQRDELPMVERLHAVTSPTLLLTGALDLPDFRLKADLIAGAVPDVSRSDDPEAGHMLTLERPEAVAAAISAFLSG